jgi:hypothetical protein
MRDRSDHSWLNHCHKFNTIVQPNEANQKVIISFDTVETLLSISNKLLRSRATKSL